MNVAEKKEFESKMIIITAPSGAGKTTIVRHLLSTFDFLDFSVSATTRSARAHEVDGRDYYFKSVEEFKDLISEEAFAEYEEVYEDQFYGTLKSEIEKIWELKKRIVFDIDVRGATNLKKQYGDKALAIFIAPPSHEVLIERLTKRKTESESSLKKRLNRVRREMKYKDNFDSVLINDNLDIALAEAEHKVLSFIYPGAKMFYKWKEPIIK